MKPPETRNYGQHLMVDGYDADPQRLQDVGRIFCVLNELPALIAMRKIGFPHLASFSEDDIAGVTGFVLIMESHISMHTYSNKNFLTADIYSCKPFDDQAAVRYLRQAFSIGRLDVQLVDRGREFPVSNLSQNKSFYNLGGRGVEKAIPNQDSAGI
jgi:S-adenosylmethionine decarboxylase